MELLQNKLRPNTLKDVLGQTHLIGKDKVLSNLIKNKVLLGDEVEIITPSERFVTKIAGIFDENREPYDLANTNADASHLTLAKMK